MKKVTFDRHVANLYEELKLIVETRYQERGQDALHDALLSIYRCKAYGKLHQKLSEKKITGWLVQAVIFCIRSRLRDESKYRRRYALLSHIESNIMYASVKEGYGAGFDGPSGLADWSADEAYPIDVVYDVQTAIGTLSAYHQSLVHAHFYDGETLREIASRIGETFYRVFTEMEIAKACLRTQLEAYRR